MTQVKQRDITVDFLKGVAIFLVLWGHSIQLLGEGTGVLSQPIGKVIYLVHMPLFMFLAGYVSVSALNLNPRKMFLKKSQQLLQPMIVWCVVFWVAKCFLGLADYSSLYLMARSLALTIFNGYWFIWVLFFSFILLKICIIGDGYLRKFNIGGGKNLVLSSIFLVLIIPYSHYIVGLNLNMFKVMYPFFAAGYLCKEWNVFERFVYRKWITGFASLIVYILGCCLVQREWFGYSLDLNIWGNDFSSLHLFYWSFLLIMGFSGILFLYYFSNLLLSQTKTSKISHLINIGRHTLVIYLIQGIVFNAFLTKYQIDLDNQLLYLIVSIVLLELIYGTIIVFAKNRYTAYWFLGKKLA